MEEGVHDVAEEGDADEIADEDDDGRARPNLAPADGHVEEEAWVARAKDGLDHIPAVEAWDREQVKGKNRAVEEDDRVNKGCEQADGRERRVNADGIECAQDQAEGDGGDEGRGGAPRRETHSVA